MRALLRAFAVVSVLLLTGCVAVQPRVDLAANTLTANPGRVGVAMSAVPKPNTYFPGAACLLCLAAAEVANSSLTTHVKTLAVDEFPKYKEAMIATLRKRGVDAVAIPEEVVLKNLPSSSKSGENVAKEDFGAFKQKHGIDRLIVINLVEVGYVRNYSAYIPNGDPKAFVSGTAFMVNLSTNTYEWFDRLNVQKGAEQAWDEAPAYPGLTNAYFQAVELAKDQLVAPFNAAGVAKTEKTAATAEVSPSGARP